MKLLITGGCGFLGSNLASHAVNAGYDLCLFDNFSRIGAHENYRWLRSQGEFKFIHGDIRNAYDVNHAIKQVKPDTVFHLAGQVAMTTSISNPRLDYEVNVTGTFNLLESIREHVPTATVIYSSTNKVYGDLSQYTYRETSTRYECIEHPSGFAEDVQLDFHSPYGCSKGAADQYMLDYSRIYGLNTVVFRHSSMYGGRQFSTYDQGWVGWFCQKAVDFARDPGGSPFTISGTGKQVRDVLHSEDMVRLYYCAVERINDIRGNAFNVGGGIENSLSLLELFSLLEEITGNKLKYKKIEPRISDQKVFVADLSKTRRMLGWTPQVDARCGVSRMVDWIESL